jgi:tetratricopeptide (TPR) repeat protein
MIRRVLLLVSVSILTTGGFLSETTAAAQAQTADTTARAKQHYHNAVTAISKGDWQTARTELIQAEKLAPQNALVHYDLALAYSHTGQTKSAQLEVNKALKLGLPQEQKQAAGQLKGKLENPALASGAERPEQNVEGPSLDETLNFLNRLISEGAVEVIDSSGQQKRWQTLVVTGEPTPCVISWGEMNHKVWNRNGKSVESPGTERRYLSLKDLRISELKVMDAKTVIGADRYNEGFTIEEGGKYSGYYIYLKQVILDKPWDLQNSVPNPTKIVIQNVLPANNLYFTAESDAERAMKALAHAATICGAKTDPF